MTNFRSFAVLAGLSAAATFTGSAHAAVVTAVGAGGIPMPVLTGYSSVATFDGETQTPYLSTTPAGPFIDGGGSWSGDGIVMNNPAGSSAGLYAEPANDTTNYMAVLGGNSETVTYSQAYSKLGLYWGSIDTYNLITLYNGANSVTVPVPSVASGDQYVSDSNRYFEITGFTFDKVVFSSSGNSFEFDNVAVGNVPEPATWAIMLVGFGGLGGVLRIARRQQGHGAATA